MLFNTLATSFIWGINTLFLLDAGLSNAQAFAANAFYTIGQLIFEVPTGIIADSTGRRASYLLGTLTLSASTLLYVYSWHIAGPFWLWAASSLLLGLGFSFFSGATDAWLVDALAATKFTGTLDSVFAKGQVVAGVAMLSGSVAGGFIAQFTNLSIPYFLRAAALVINFILAFIFMKDIGFEPEKSANFREGVNKIITTSIKFGWNNSAIKWLMIAAPFTSGVGFYSFYAMQPYLLQLYGNQQAYGIAGLAAAIVASAQIFGGLAVPYIRKLFHLRTSALIVGVFLNFVLLLIIGFTTNFLFVILALSMWALIFAATAPIRSAFLNSEIPSKQRATVLSFDALMGSSGGVVLQPGLGRAADLWSYSTSFIIGGTIQLLAAPFIFLTRRQHTNSDIIK